MKRHVSFISLFALIFSCNDAPLPDSVLTEKFVLDTEEGTELVCFITESYPKFPGGSESWKKFVKENLKQTRECVEGSVFLSFAIDETGQLSDIDVLRGINKTIDQGAIAMLEKSPRWIVPKSLQGHYFKSQMSIMIRFPLNL